MLMMEITEQEQAQLIAQRDENGRFKRALKRRAEILKVAYQYELWLQANGRGSSFTTFCDEFGYQSEANLSSIYAAVNEVRQAAIDNESGYEGIF